MHTQKVKNKQRANIKTSSKTQTTVYTSIYVLVSEGK